MNSRFHRVLRALFAGLAAAAVSSCGGGGGGSNADGAAPSAPPSASTTISVDSAVSVAAISEISSPLGVLSSGQKALDIPIRPDGTSDTILLATNANDDVLLAAFAGPNGTTTLSSASTAVVMTRAALETLPEPGPSTAQFSAMILSAGGYAELVAAIDAAVQAGGVPMKSLRVQDSLRIVVSQVRSAILNEFPQAAVASTSEARSASRPRILAATPPPLPYRLVDTPSFPALTVDNGDGGLINIRNFSLIDWRVQSKGLDGAVINGIFLPALDIWKSPFTSLVFDTKLSPPVPLQGSRQFIVTAFPDADRAATQMVNAIISLAKTPFSSALPNTALNSSCVSAIILPLVSSQLGALLVHPSDATLNEYFAGFFNSPSGTNSLLAAIKKCTPVFTGTAVDAYLNYLSKGNKFIATIAFVPDIMAANARIKQIALFTGTTASVEICMTGSVITPCSIVIDPATPLVPVGRTLQLTALTGIDRLPYPSGGALTWADLSNPFGASIDASTGLLQGVGTMENGIAVDHITVSNPWGDVANVDVTVYLPRIAEVGAGAPGGVATLALVEGGQSKFLQLIDPSGKPADIKPSYVWAAFDDKFLVVNGVTGEIKAKVAGDTDVTATDPLTGTKISAPVHINPAPPLSIDPGNLTLTLGDTQLLLIVEGGTPPTNPPASRFDWTSSHSEVATVDPTGLVVASGAGVTTISAADRMSTRTALAVVTVLESTSNYHFLANGSGIDDVLILELFDAAGTKISDITNQTFGPLHDVAFKAKKGDIIKVTAIDHNGGGCYSIWPNDILIGNDLTKQTQVIATKVATCPFGKPGGDYLFLDHIPVSIKI